MSSKKTLIISPFWKESQMSPEVSVDVITFLSSLSTWCDSPTFCHTYWTCHVNWSPLFCRASSKCSTLHTAFKQLINSEFSEQGGFVDGIEGSSGTAGWWVKGLRSASLLVLCLLFLRSWTDNSTVGSRHANQLLRAQASSPWCWTKATGFQWIMVLQSMTRPWSVLG